MKQSNADRVAELGPAPTTPAEALAHVVKVYADTPDEMVMIMATSNVYGDRVRTGLTMGDLRALAAEQRDSSEPVACRECGSTGLAWTATPRNGTGVTHGRLGIHDVSVMAVLGCEECSATVDIRPIDDMVLTPRHAMRRQAGA